MKKGVKSICLIVFLLIIFLLIVNIATAIEIIGKTITGESITGEIITGEATQTVSMNITVLAQPTLNILSPENKTYLTNNSILLNYSVSSADAMYYNLDNLENITITSSAYFNTSQGSHTLYLYANNSYGTSAKSVAFTINSTRFVILYSEYNGSTKGSSTNFIVYPYEDLQNLNNIILENTLSGKILFNQAINLTNDENPNDNILDLDSYTNVSFNRIELNSSALPNFNKSATLWLYNLTFSNPKILKDGETCPLTICTIESYSAGTLKLNVTGFSIYTTIETPSEEIYETPSPSGGGGIIATKKLGFGVEPELIKVIIKKGETFKYSIKVKNIGTLTQEFKVEALYLEDSVSTTTPKFLLKPGEEKEIILIFSPPESLKEGTYTGKIKISSGGQEKEIPVILSIKSKIILFDLTLLIPPQYKEVKPGEEVLFQISVFNLGGGGKADVEITYYIKDFEGNTITEQKGIVGVETQASFSRTVKLPEDIKEGQYIAGANAKYDDSIGTASDVFYVSKLEIGLIKRFIPITIISLIILIVLIILLIFYFRRKIKGISKTYEKELNKIEGRIREGHLKLVEATKMEKKLKSQLALLEKAYKRGYITKQSYETGKSRIKSAYSSLKKKYL